MTSYGFNSILSELNKNWESKSIISKSVKSSILDILFISENRHNDIDTLLKVVELKCASNIPSRSNLINHPQYFLYIILWVKKIEIMHKAQPLFDVLFLEYFERKIVHKHLNNFIKLFFFKCIDIFYISFTPLSVIKRKYLIRIYFTCIWPA